MLSRTPRRLAIDSGDWGKRRRGNGLGFSVTMKSKFRLKFYFFCRLWFGPIFNSIWPIKSSLLSIDRL